MKCRGSTIQYVRDLFLKKNGSLSSLLARGTASTLIVSVIFSCVNFALNVLLAREMGATGYGAYSYAIAWTAVMGVVANLGFPQVIIRDTSAYVQLQDSGRLRGLMRFSFKWTLAASLLSIVAAVVPALFQFWSSQSMELQLLGSAFILVPLNALLLWAAALQQGQSRVGRAQIPSTVVSPLLFLAAVLTFIVWSGRKLDAVSVIYMQIVATSAALGYALVTLRATIAPKIASASPVYESARWLSGAIKLVLIGSMYLLNVNADILLLGAILGPEAAGIYKVATRGADLVMYSLIVINFPLSPIIARLHAAGDRDRLRRAITLSTRVAALVALPVATGLVFVGDRFLALFGEGFQQGRSALAILSISQLVNAATGPVGWIMITAGYETRTAIAVTVGAVTNIALNLMLIPRYGILGAAVATTTSMMLWNGMLVFQVWYKLGIDPTIFGLVKGDHSVSNGG